MLFSISVEKMLFLFGYRNPLINTAPITKTSIITVELFVTTARLAGGQTSVIMVKIGVIILASVKNVLACRN